MDITQVGSIVGTTVKMGPGENIDMEINVDLDSRSEPIKIGVVVSPLPSGKSIVTIFIPLNNAFVSHPLNEWESTRNAIILICDEYNPSKLELVISENFPRIVDSFISLKSLLPKPGDSQ
jgi:hypothetical protein